ncbi:MAG: metallophosphoesterase [Anaerolineaceae bacterium]|nr:MAG: metallophosphoesterase [Anaerolineaceae bacterium]
MKILAVSDTVVDKLYSPRVGEYFRGVDLVLGCGDLPYEYLEFLVSSLNVPLLYVPGNHDPAYNEHNPSARAEGCENLDRRVARVKGLTVAGLGGCHRYQPGRANQYSQPEMYARAAALLPALLWQRLRSGARTDILIAHSPPRGIHDDDDLPHHGFSAFLPLLRLARPRYFLHGHTLVYKSNLEPPVTQVGPTTVVNISPYRLIEVAPHVR